MVAVIPSELEKPDPATLEITPDVEVSCCSAFLDCKISALDEAFAADLPDAPHSKKEIAAAAMLLIFVEKIKRQPIRFCRISSTVHTLTYVDSAVGVAWLHPQYFFNVRMKFLNFESL